MNTQSTSPDPASPTTAAEWIRISGASLCRIQHPTRGYFLLLNYNRRQKGVYVLSPIGGALEFYDEGLLARFGAHLEDPAHLELRLTLPKAQLPAFRAWFYTAEGREHSPFRELEEELVHEAQLLPRLAPEDVTCKRLWTLERERLTDRKGQTGLLTHYFLEIYDITFKRDAIMGPLIIAPAASGALWVTEAQLTSPDPVTMHVDGAERDVRVSARQLLKATTSPTDVLVYPPDAKSAPDDTPPDNPS
ncbi:MAG: hypothetical protein K8S97_13375 [Anaerolineae bacterium]|nr:hypothetical protein [Anaerolineae bacterium]